MCQSTVSVSCVFNPVNLNDIPAVKRALPIFNALAAKIESHISTKTCAPIVWKEITSTQDPEYLPAICKHAEAVGRAALIDIADILNQLGVKPSCKQDIVIGPLSTCKYCGQDCHEVDGKPVDKCPGVNGTKETQTPFLIRVSDGHRVIICEFGLRFRFIFGDCGCHETTLSAKTTTSLADQVYEYYARAGKFPPFWASFDNRLEHLRTIFDFFAGMRAYQNDQQFMPLIGTLWQRLAERHAGAEVPKATYTLNAVSKLSDELMAFLDRTLGKAQLVGPAFDAFASGSLSMSAELRNLGVVEANAFDLPEPDGPTFLCWAEFGFLAMDLNVPSAQAWQKLMPELLRAEHIFACAYGDPDGRGRPDRKWTASNYNTNKIYRSILPKQVDGYRFDSRLPSSYRAAGVQALRFACPGGMS